MDHERQADIEQLSIATLRSLSIDQVQAAQSGHIGFPLGAAPILHTLYAHYLRSDPAAPDWIGRDRFVLSAGHGSALLYATLHLAGYDIGIEDLQRFRQWQSRTPGHPESHLTPGVDATTGPLGQGIANAVGMAIAESMANARYRDGERPLIDHRTFVLASDGDLMEGVSLEAAALAGLLKLGKLIVFYDDNDVVIDGRASDVHDAAGVCAALAALGWHVTGPVDGEDLAGIRRATDEAIAETARPSLIRVRTHIGHGSPLSNDPRSHSGAFTVEDARATKAALGREFAEPFSVPREVASWWRSFAERGAQARRVWNETLDRAGSVGDALRAPGRAARAHSDLADAVPLTGEAEAARLTSGRVLEALEEIEPTLVGGAADLVQATMARLPGGGEYSATDRAGRNIRFGVREHAMGAIANGIALHGIFRPFASTFLVFTSYQANALRMAALQGLPVIHLLTHDSITVGEDGPTHQPVEMLAMLRAMPNMLVLRPADARETIECWGLALQNTSGPTALILSRIALPPLDRQGARESAGRGAYVLADAVDDEPDVVIVASGSEVSLAVEARSVLGADGVSARVVSMPSHELFAAQDDEYRRRVLPPGVPRLVVEASHSLSLWRWAGPDGDAMGVDRFGASAPPAVLQREYGLTAPEIARRAMAICAPARSERTMAHEPAGIG